MVCNLHNKCAANNKLNWYISAQKALNSNVDTPKVVIKNFLTVKQWQQQREEV